MEKIKASEKGQVVIPARIRRKYALHPVTEIGIFEYDNLVYLPRNPIGEAMGCLPKQPSLSKQLIKERTVEA